MLQCLQLLEDIIFTLAKDIGQYRAGRMINRTVQNNAPNNGVRVS